MTNTEKADDGAFPYISRMIACHGFDGVFAGGVIRGVPTPCKKSEGTCCIKLCRLIPSDDPGVPKKYDIFGNEVDE